jgi:hypothetical protein
MNMNSTPNWLRCAALVVLLLAGCTSLKFQQKAGTEFTDTGKGLKATTYVTPEQYENMTPAERERLNASVGVSATVATWGKTDPQPQEVSTQDLDKAQKASKE